MLTRCGDDLFSVAVDSPQDAQAMAVAVRAAGDWLEVVPGIDTVIVRFDAAQLGADAAQRKLENTVAAGIQPLPLCGELLEIPIQYGGEFGPDLESLSEQTGLAVDELIARHSGGEYSVDMIGFTPGFAFIGGLDDCFKVPRREEPRQQVAAGSVGIADGRTGLYAMASPGGWNIIGRTQARLFDASAEDPFVLKAGMRVRFKAV